MKNILKRSLIIIGLVITGLIFVSSIAMAVPSTVTDFYGIAYSSSISLAWTPASGSTSTVIRYSTVDYPTTPASGTSAYNGSSSYTTVISLSPGVTYYFAAWGYDGADYSASSATLVISTNPATSENTTIPYPKPSMPASSYQDPDTSGWDISPIDEIFAWVADPTNSHGGLGMPTNNYVMFIAGISVTGIGLFTYVKWRSFFSSWFIVVILSALLCAVSVMQWIVVGILLLVGAGVWAIENKLQ